jgi:hypothetical protein
MADMIECPKEWHAWYNRMPGADDKHLHVTGTVKCFSGSIQLRLEPGNEGVDDQPELFVLDLWVKRPPFGTDDVVDKDVDWWGDAGQDIKVVRIQRGCDATTNVVIANREGSQPPWVV